MRYVSQADAHLMRRRAMDPSILMRRRGLGALTSGGLGSGSTASSAAQGASVGASIGSVVPVIGTAIGALVGGAVGAIMSAFNRQDQEVQNFNQAQQMAQAQGAAAVLSIQNKYLVLAGLFDLQPSQIKGNIPFYKKYGRMGEQRFVTDMCAQIQDAANRGMLSDNDTPQSVYAKVVGPWINGMGFGSLADSNATMIQYILMGMIAEYCAGIFTQRWFARGGQMPFGSIPPFSLPRATQPAQPQVTASPTPSPVAVTPSPTPSGANELQSYLGGWIPTAGATVNYAYNGTTFLQLPHAMTYVGKDMHNGQWIVATSDGAQYELSGSTLMPYSSTVVVQTPTQTVAPQVNQTVPVSASDSMGTQIQAQYIPSPQSSGGGGGGYYPTPAMSNALAPVSQGPSTNTMLEIGGGAVLVLGLLYFLMQKKHA